jgi:hypothetical protein
MGPKSVVLDVNHAKTRTLADTSSNLGPVMDILWQLHVFTSTLDVKVHVNREDTLCFYVPNSNCSVQKVLTREY